MNTFCVTAPLAACLALLACDGADHAPTRAASASASADQQVAIKGGMRFKQANQQAGMLASQGSIGYVFRQVEGQPVRAHLDLEGAPATLSARAWNDAQGAFGAPFALESGTAGPAGASLTLAFDAPADGIYSLVVTNDDPQASRNYLVWLETRDDAWDLGNLINTQKMCDPATNTTPHSACSHGGRCRDLTTVAAADGTGIGVCPDQHELDTRALPDQSGAADAQHGRHVPTAAGPPGMPALISLGTDSAGAEHRAILSFDTSVLPANAEILTVEFVGGLNTMVGYAFGAMVSPHCHAFAQQQQFPENLVFDFAQAGGFSGDPTLEGSDFDAPTAASTKASFEALGGVRLYMASGWALPSAPDPDVKDAIQLDGMTQLRLRLPAAAPADCMFPLVAGTLRLRYTLAH